MKKTYLEKHKDIIDYLLNRYNDINYSINDISEIIFRILNNINIIPQCSCGKKLKYKSFFNGYGKHCNIKCASNDPSVKEKLVKTNLEK